MSRDPRLERLREPHIAPLTEYVERLRRKRGGGESVPWVDPSDGGAHAHVLLLLESPGRKAMGGDSPTPDAGGSGFVSVTNADATARMTLACRTEAGLSAADVVHWNAVPWYVGDADRLTGVRTSDVVEALPAIRDFLRLLPDLRVVVCMGRKAEDGWSRLIKKYPSTASIPMLACPHPSGRSVNRPGARDLIVATLRQAKELVDR